MKIKPSDLGSRFLKNYELGEYIGSGGNGIVFKVKKLDDKKEFAIKILKIHRGNKDDLRKQRFDREIESLKKLEISAVMPILDFNISADGLRWYLMPIAEPITNFLKRTKVNYQDEFQILLEIAKGLKDVHDNEYAHRDIKPDNIFVINNQIVFGDFGLVWHPEFTNISTKYEKIGAFFTIAPEMYSDEPLAKRSKKADIYSLAKTIWMILKEKRFSFDGHYNFDSKYYIEYNDEQLLKKGIRTIATFNRLLMESTNEDPLMRPDIYKVIEYIELWIAENKLAEKEISLINQNEVINRNLHIIKSNVEVYTDFNKVRDFLNEIFKANVYSLLIELSNGEYDVIFRTNKVQPSEIEGGMIFVSTNNKRYLVLINKLEIDKQNNKMILCVTGIKLENISMSNIYEYKDFYSTSRMDRLFGDFEEQNEKSIVEVMSKSEKFVLSIVN
jgi:serine/threonine protein kinase